MAPVRREFRKERWMGVMRVCWLCRLVLLGGVLLRRLYSERKRSLRDLCLADGLAIKRFEGHLVDALASRGDEGRGTLRKAVGSCEQALIRGYPNGETRPLGVILD